MSLFYLLQHYNSENKRIYDEQKNAKKALKDNDKNTSKQKKKSKEKKNTSNPVVPNIAIPGQPVAPVSSSKSDNDSYEEKENALQPETTSNSAENVAAINNTPFDFGSIDNSINSDFDEGTVVIGEETAKQQSCAYLLRIKTNEQIYITKSSFKIGRNNELIDYDLKDNKYVGRLHCHFIIRDNQYYIVDDNSRNHTYLDNVMLTGSVEVEVKHGQRIKIADEDFEFRMY